MNLSTLINFVGGGLLVFVLVLLGGAFFLNQHLQSAEFKESILTVVRDLTRTEVDLQGMHISLLSGVTLQGVTFANPEGFANDLLTVQELVLRHRLFPLISRCVAIDELRVLRPVVRFVQREDESWNFEHFLSGQKELEPSSDFREAGFVGGSTVDIELSKFSINRGEVFIRDSGDRLLTHVQGITLASAVDFAESTLNVTGKLGVEEVNFGGSLFVKELDSLVEISKVQMVLPTVSGKVADGSLSGEVTFKTAPEFSFTVDLELEDADFAQLLEDAQIRLGMTGRLQARIQASGSELAAMTGEGQAKLVQGRISGLPAQDFVAGLLQVPALKEIEFEEVLLEYSLADNVLNTPVIRMISPLVQVTGAGRLLLSNKELDHDVTVALSEEVLASVPKQFLRVFEHRDDGFHMIQFRVWGPYDSPSTDLQHRLVQGVTNELLDKGLNLLRGLFR